SISKYRRADYLCVHDGEIRIDTRSRVGNIRTLVSDVARRSSCPTVMVTRGSKGTPLYSEDERFFGSPALAHNGVDRIGARLARSFRVKVLDRYIFGDDVLEAVKNDPNLQQIRGDIRDRNLLKRVIPGCDAVIHLACISNDPSFELNPELGRSINYDAFEDLV